MTGYAAETETVLTRAHIDENFADKANWIHQIEEVRHRLGPSVSCRMPTRRVEETREAVEMEVSS